MAAVDDSADAGAAPKPPPAAAPEAEAKPPAMPDQQPRWADPIFRAGLIVGSALFVIGIFCQALNLIAPTLSILVICSGLGIIFGAFGSTAVINYKGVVIAGVAAIAVALLLIVDWVMRESLVRIEVDGDVKGARLELFGDSAYPGADHGGRRFEFFIIGREITKDRLSLVVTLPAAEMERSARSGSREIAFDCIPSTAITRYIGGGKTLQWRFDAGREVLTGVDGATIKSGPCFDDEDTPSFASLGLVGAAMAQDASIDALLADLESEFAAVRREARLQLAELGEAAVVPMMNYWEEPAGQLSGEARRLDRFDRDPPRRQAGPPRHRGAAHRQPPPAPRRGGWRSRPQLADLRLRVPLRPRRQAHRADCRGGLSRGQRRRPL